jgi:hypothetical protein
MHPVNSNRPQIATAQLGRQPFRVHTCRYRSSCAGAEAEVAYTEGDGTSDLGSCNTSIIFIAGWALALAVAGITFAGLGIGFLLWKAFKPCRTDFGEGAKDAFDTAPPSAAVPASYPTARHAGEQLQQHAYPLGTVVQDSRVSTLVLLSLDFPCDFIWGGGGINRVWLLPFQPFFSQTLHFGSRHSGGGCHTSHTP